MEEKATGIKKYLPNIASFVRIIGVFSLIPLTQLTMDLGSFKAVPLIWIIVDLFLVFTDKVDGTLARKFHAESELGATLDALGDALLIVVGGLCVFIVFVKDALMSVDFLGIKGFNKFWVCVAIMGFCISTKLLVFSFAAKFHKKGNMLHSYPQKLFALACYLAVPAWAFLRDLPEWSILLLMAINIYATLDECIYCARSAEYDVDFKGHGFEKYPLREK
jgi:phosphatidylglycerophosphate synthase